MNIPIDVGVRGKLTTVTLTRLTNIATARLGTKVSSFHKMSHHFSFQLGDRGAIFLASCTRRPTRVERDVRSIQRLCHSHGVVTVFRPRLCSHAESFCGRFTRDLSLTSRILLASVCPTHRGPVPKIADRLICSGVTSNIRGRLYEGRRISRCVHHSSTSIFILLKTKSLRSSTPLVARVLEGQ